jgi:hypothetical protein
MSTMTNRGSAIVYGMVQKCLLLPVATNSSPLDEADTVEASVAVVISESSWFRNGFLLALALVFIGDGLDLWGVRIQ